MDQISTLKASLADRYAIEKEIGEGGMATVYLARDVRHDRHVALKVLKPELGAVLGLERFQAEIRVTANLQHPNLLPLFDSGEANGLLYYVMPFVEGETLRARIAREKQLPVEEAVRISVAVASALEYAHAHGVIHRDLKPENILLQAGQPVVADFGIALAVSNAGGSRITQTGLSLGTPQYMSPEQATGDRVVDGRSDIYSLGAMAFEMLTGEAPHTGTTAQAIIARLLTEKPRSIRSIRPNVPPAVEAAIEHALEKLPADRFTSAREFAEAIQGRGMSHMTEPRPSAAGADRRGILARLRDPVVAGALLVAVAAVGGSLARRPAASTAAPLPTVRFEVTLPDSFTLGPGTPWPGAVAPDGSSIVFFGKVTSQPFQLWLRRSDKLGIQPIPGSSEAYQPIYSPDGKWIAFEAGTPRKLVKVRLDDGSLVRICTAGSANGGDWTINNEIILGAESEFHGLTRVSANGGDLVEFTHPGKTTPQVDHLWPIAAPDGETIAFVLYDGSLNTAQLAFTSTRDGRVDKLGVRGIRPLAFADKHLVYLQADGTIMAVPVDVRGHKATGPSTPVHEPVDVAFGFNGNSEASIGIGGGLITIGGVQESTLGWLTRTGTITPISREPRLFGSPRLSPDGNRIAVEIGNSQDVQVWVQDLSTGTLTRLTSMRTAWSPEWMPDGKSLMYLGSDEAGKTTIQTQAVNGGSPSQQLYTPTEVVPASVTPTRDGTHALYMGFRGISWDIFDLAIGDGKAPSSHAYLAGTENEFNPRMSPDGHWVAIRSDESGKAEVSVRSYPDPSVRVQVSTGGVGFSLPFWSLDGSKLYYQTLSGALVSANVSTAKGFTVVSRDSIVMPRAPNGTKQTFIVYDIARDGRFLGLIPQKSTARLVYSPNWIVELRERLAANATK